MALFTSTPLCRNFSGSTNACHCIVREMLESKRGSIISINTNSLTWKSRGWLAHAGVEGKKISGTLL